MYVQMSVQKHVFVKAPLCESTCVQYFGRLLLESLRLRKMCRKIAPSLQHSAASTCTVHGMMQHQFIARGFAIGQHLNIGKLHDICQIWNHVCKLCCDVHSAVKQKICTLCRNQKLSLAQYVRHTGANFSASRSLCSICNYHW